MDNQLMTTCFVEQLWPHRVGLIVDAKNMRTLFWPWSLTDPDPVPALQEGLVTTQAPESLVFVTWNIDGLDQHNLKKRTKAVAKILEQEAADIVFLQEVIPETFSYLESKLPGYQVLHAARICPNVRLIRPSPFLDDLGPFWRT